MIGVQLLQSLVYINQKNVLNGVSQIQEYFIQDLVQDLKNYLKKHDNNTKDISLFFMFGIDIEDIYMLAQNKPNPFTDHTLIQFTLPEATTATLTITDLAGKIVWQRTAFYEAGVQSETIRLDDLKTSGVFFYHLQAGNFRASRRMVQLAK